MLEMRPWEKDIELRFRHPSFFKPTLSEALLVTIAGVSLFAWQKSPPSLLKRVLKATLILTTFFGIYKGWEIKKWQDGKGKLLSKEDLKLDELGELPPEERAFLIRKYFFGNLSYTDFLERHGVENLEQLFSKGKNLGYQDCLKKKFLEAVKAATTLEELLKISSFPSLSVSLKEYQDALPSNLGCKLTKEVWGQLRLSPNYDVVRSLIDANIKPDVLPAVYWLKTFSFNEKICLDFVYSGNTDIQILCQKEVWKLIGRENNLLKMLTIPNFKPSGPLSEIENSYRNWKSEDVIKLIQRFNLKVNSSDLSSSPLWQAILDQDNPLVNALVFCGATVSVGHIKAVIDRDNVLLIEELAKSKGFDLNRSMEPGRNTNIKMPPIVYAILDKKGQVAKWFWKQPNLEKNIKWQRHDSLEALAKAYKVDLW